MITVFLPFRDNTNECIKCLIMNKSILFSYLPLCFPRMPSLIYGKLAVEITKLEYVACTYLLSEAINWRLLWINSLAYFDTECVPGTVWFSSKNLILQPLLHRVHCLIGCFTLALTADFISRAVEVHDQPMTEKMLEPYSFTFTEVFSFNFPKYTDRVLKWNIGICSYMAGTNSAHRDRQRNN